MKNDYSKEFRQCIIYWRLSIIIFFCGTLSSSLIIKYSDNFNYFQDKVVTIGIIVFFVSIFLSFLFMSAVKCPYCGYKFDMRVYFQMSDYCPHCKVKLRE
ncbi:hypothetical protein [Oceanirhabdus sp. W0125-5]|uniref:hypothetical protein n=1 Tax=Oceanirhabdus sp. W0125-5 TaxID=2999116 RepID=UPI0022F31C5D|nr:hypothetical protein [Oceanirhabdus sp. W0125-5]WBW99481.1 hypothetical protein OW730_12255 [Oceanirhabdus sp. W0125-5]